jgi:hypothetical protein
VSNVCYSNQGPPTSVCCPPGVNCCNGKCCQSGEVCCFPVEGGGSGQWGCNPSFTCTE